MGEGGGGVGGLVSKSRASLSGGTKTKLSQH